MLWLGSYLQKRRGEDAKGDRADRRLSPAVPPQPGSFPAILSVPGLGLAAEVGEGREEEGPPQ